MVEGEAVMPVPEGIISTSTGPVDPTAQLDEAIVEADAEEATAEYAETTDED
jgi:hypothetical protein